MNKDKNYIIMITKDNLFFIKEYKHVYILIFNRQIEMISLFLFFLLEALNYQTDRHQKVNFY